jgi:hypothetical protein
MMSTANRESVQQLVAEWTAWSRTASRLDNGWENDFPRWGEFVRAAGTWLSSPDARNASSATLISHLLRIDGYWEDLQQVFEREADHLVAPLRVIIEGKERGPANRAVRYIAKASSTDDSFLEHLAKSDCWYLRSSAVAVLYERTPRSMRFPFAQSVIADDPDEEVRGMAKSLLDRDYGERPWVTEIGSVPVHAYFQAGGLQVRILEDGVVVAVGQLDGRLPRGAAADTQSVVLLLEREGSPSDQRLVCFNREGELRWQLFAPERDQFVDATLGSGGVRARTWNGWVHMINAVTGQEEKRVFVK